MNSINPLSKALNFFFFALFTLLTSVRPIAAQQVNAFVNVFPPYPLELEYYLDHYESFYLELQNNSSQFRRVYLGIRLTSDYGLDVRSNTGYRPLTPFLLKSGQSTVFDENDFEDAYGDLMYPDDFTVSGVSPEVEELIQVQRILPEGSYRLCVSVYDWDTDAMLTEACSRWFTVEVGDVPMIIQPQNHEELAEEAISLFSWDPPVNVSMEYELEYSLKIIDYSEYGMSGFDNESLFADPGVSPVFETDGLTETYYQYDAGGNDPVLETGRTYMMRVTVKDVEDRLQFQNNGHSEIVFFTIEPETIVMSSVDVTATLATADGKAPYDSPSVKIDWSLSRKEKISKYDVGATLYDITDVYSTFYYMDEEAQVDFLKEESPFLSESEKGMKELEFETTDEQYWKAGNIYAAHIACSKGENTLHDILIFECVEMEGYEVELRLAEKDSLVNTNQEAVKVAWEISPAVAMEKVYSTLNIYSFDSSQLDTAVLNSMNTWDAITLLEDGRSPIFSASAYNMTDTSFQTIREHLWYSDASRFYAAQLTCISPDYNFTVKDVFYFNCFSDLVEIQGELLTEDGNIDKGEEEKLDWEVINRLGISAALPILDSKCDCEVDIHDLTARKTRVDELMAASERNQLRFVQRMRNPIHSDTLEGQTWMMINSADEKWEMGHQFVAHLDCNYDGNYTEALIYFSVEDDLITSIYDEDENGKDFLLANSANGKVQVSLVSERPLSDFTSSIRVYDIQEAGHFELLSEGEQMSEISALSLIPVFQDTLTEGNLFSVDTRLSDWVVGNRYMVHIQSREEDEEMNDIFFFTLKENELDYDVVSYIPNTLQGYLRVGATPSLGLFWSFEPDNNDRLPCSLKAYDVTGYETELQGMEEGAQILELEEFSPIFSTSTEDPSASGFPLFKQGSEWEVGQYYGFHLRCTDGNLSVEDVLVVEAVDSMMHNAELSFTTPAEHREVLPAEDGEIQVSWDLDLPEGYSSESIEYTAYIYDMTAAGLSAAEALTFEHIDSLRASVQLDTAHLVYRMEGYTAIPAEELSFSEDLFRVGAVYMLVLQPWHNTGSRQEEVVFSQFEYCRSFSVEKAMDVVSYIPSTLQGYLRVGDTPSLGLFWSFEPDNNDRLPCSLKAYDVTGYETELQGMEEGAQILELEEFSPIFSTSTEDPSASGFPLFKQGSEWEVGQYYGFHLRCTDGNLSVEDVLVVEAVDSIMHNAELSFISPAEHREVLPAEDGEIQVSWDLDLPEGYSSESIEYTAYIYDMTAAGLSAAEALAFEHIDSLRASVQLDTAHLVYRMEGYTAIPAEELSFSEDLFRVGAVYMLVLQPWHNTGSRQEEVVFSQFEYCRSFSVDNEPDVEGFILNTPEGYMPVDTSWMPFSWAFSPEGFQAACSLEAHQLGSDTYMIQDMSEEAKVAVLQSRTPIYSTSTEDSTAVGFNLANSETEWVAGANYGLYLSCTNGDVTVEDVAIVLAIDSVITNAELTILNPIEEGEEMEAGNNKLAFEWEVAVPETLADDSVKYNLGVYDLSASGLSTSEIEAVTSVDDLLASPKYNSQHYVFTTEPDELITEKEYEIEASALTSGNSYLLVLIPISTESPQLVFKNNGAVRHFVFSDEEAECMEDCYYTETISERETYHMLSHSTIQVGHFEMTDLNYTSTSQSSGSGTGVIEVDFLMGAKVEVEFTDIKVNNEGRMYSGTVKAKGNATGFDLARLNTGIENGSEVEPETAEELYAFLLNDNNVSAMAFGQEVSMPLGLEQSIKGYHFVLGFTEMTFEKDKATANIIASLYLPTMGETNYIALGASDICMTPGGFAGEYMLHLADDLLIQHDGDWAFQLDGGTGEADSLRQQATYLEVDCQGIKGFAIRGRVDLPNTVVVQEDDEGSILTDELVTAAFAFQVERGGEADSLEQETKGMHWWAAVDMDPFQIKGLEGWGFEIDEAYLDMSDLANPREMRFPATYDEAQTDASWQGLYVKSAKIKTPAEFLNGKGRKSAEIHDLLIDPQVSLTLAVTNILSTNEGNMDGWGFSIDSLYLSIAEGSFQASGMQGKLGMPLMEEDAYLQYTALISQNAGDTTSYSFAINHQGSMKIPMCIAEAELKENSYVKIKYTPAEKDIRLTTFLKGAMTLDTENIAEGTGIQKIASLKLPSTDFQFKYDSRNGFSDADFGFSSNDNNNSTAYLHSPDELLWASIETDIVLEELARATGSDGNAQNILSGFPISILETDLSMSGTEVALSLTPQLALQGDEDGFSVSTKFSILSELQTNTEGKKHFKLTGLEVECVSLDIDAGNTQMAGELCFYNDQDENGVGDKGLKGALSVLVPGVQVGVNLAAEFGTRVTDEQAAFGTEDNFSYWFVDGLFFVGSTGIVIPPGYVTLHGLGGRIAVNMEKTSTEEVSAEVLRAKREISVEEATGATPNVEPETSGIEMEPAFGARGLSFTVIFAGIRQEAFNMDLTLGATWQKGEGLQTIEVGGDAYFMTPLMDRANPQLYADADLEFYLPGDGDFAFSGNLDMYMDLGVARGGHADNLAIDDAGFHIQNFGGDSGNGYWDVKLGTYEKPAKVIMDMAVVEVSGSQYIMLGNNVPTSLAPYPDRIVQLLNNSTTSEGDNSVETESIEEEPGERSAVETQDYATGNGIAFGRTFEVDAELDAGIAYMDLGATVGMDLNISQDDARVCYVQKTGETQTAGVNGWYGSGQVYAGIEGDIGVKVKLMGEEQKINLFRLAGVMAMQGGAPAPVWAEGRITLSYSVLNGRVSGSSRFPASFGDKCTPTHNDPLAGIDIIAETFPADGATDVSPYTDPIVAFNLPIDEVIYIPTINEFEEEVIERYKPYLEDFYVEQQGEGRLTANREYWENGYTEYRQRYADPFEPKQGKKAPTFNMYTLIRAKKWNSGSNVWSELYVDGEQWAERDTATFKTGEHPDHFDDDYVKKSVPLNRQRYFLQDEVMNDEGGLYFKYNMDLFFPESDAKGTYKYYLRFKAVGQEDIDIDITSEVAGKEGVRNILFDLPELENSTLYALQVVRKNVQKFSGNNSHSEDQLLSSFSSADTDNDTYNEYEIYTHGGIDESKKVGNNERLVYVFYFQTSAYNSLEEKLAGATLSTSGDVLYLQTDEAFDEYDIFGTTDGDGNVVLPRVFLTDPFESDYHTRVASSYIRKPLIDYVDHMLTNNPVIYSNYSYNLLRNIMEIPGEELHFDWAANDLSFIMNGNVFGGYAGTIGDQQLQREWSALSGLFAGEGKGLQLLPDGKLPDGWDFDLAGNLSSETTSSNGLAIKYDLHQRVEEDAETLEEWMTNMLDTYVPAITTPYIVPAGFHYQTYFDDYYEEIFDWQTDLLNRDDVLLQAGVGQATSGTASGSVGGAFQTKGKSSGSGALSDHGTGSVRETTWTTYQLDISSEKSFSNYRLEKGSEERFEFKMK